MTELLEIPFKPESGKPPTAVLHRLLDAIYRAGDKRLVLTLKEQKAKRSNAQNAYYFGVVVKTVTAFFREHGNYVDELDVHEFLKLRVGKLGQVFVMPDGEVQKGIGSTAKLTKSEFMDYIAKIQAWAAEYGCIIPNPNEVI